MFERDIDQKVCFSIPIHPPNYYLLPNLENIVRKTGVNIFIILNQEDCSLETQFSCFNYIYFNNLHDKEVKNWPTEKKFFANKYIFDSTEYKYIVSCDSEIKLDRLFNQCTLYSICENVFTKKEFYGGGDSDDVFQIINTDCMKFLELDDSFIESHRDIYFWFSELPIYEKDTFLRFFDDQNLAVRSYSFNHFDYLLYAYWLCVNENFRIVDWNKLSKNQNLKLSCSGELLSTIDFFQMLEYHGITLHWLSHNYAKHIKNRNVLIKYHVDRPVQNGLFLKVKRICKLFMDFIHKNE